MVKLDFKLYNYGCFSKIGSKHYEIMLRVLSSTYPCSEITNWEKKVVRKSLYKDFLDIMNVDHKLLNQYMN